MSPRMAEFLSEAVISGFVLTGVGSFLLLHEKLITNTIKIKA